MARKKPKKGHSLTAIRKMNGPAVFSMLATKDEAADRVACGWTPLGTSGEQIIIVADAEAMASWSAKSTTGDSSEAEDQ